jgi:hypothetical protein
MEAATGEFHTASTCATVGLHVTKGANSGSEPAAGLKAAGASMMSL